MEQAEIEKRASDAASKAVVTHLTASGRDADTVKKAHVSYQTQAKRRGEKYVEMAEALVPEPAGA